MKIVSKQEFLKLPPGTIFSDYQPQCLSGFKVKAESSIGISDFIYSDLTGNPQNTGSEDFGDKCEAMEQGESVPIDVEFYGREGFYDDNMLYAVYERDDLKKIIGVLEAALTV
jgi:hypothetical protein